MGRTAYRELPERQTVLFGSVPAEPSSERNDVTENAKRYLGKLLVLRTGPGERHAIGQCVSYCDAPTVTIRQLDGTEIHWRADLCEVRDLTLEEVGVLVEQANRLRKCI